MIEGGQIYLVRTDHIGRPVFATTLAGTKVWSASYLPFGGVNVTTGAPIDARFPGQWFQVESGLHQNWMRDYDPTTGRYIEPDPLGLVDGASIYGYARQNPGRYTDPRGLWTGQLGPSISISGFGLGFTFGFGITVDGCGNIAFYGIGGLGAAVGAGASAGVAVEGSNANTVCDLEGWFVNYSGNVGAGPDVGGETFYGSSGGKPVAGGGAVLGVGAGAGGMVGPTYTGIWSLNNSSDCGCGCGQ